MPELSLFLVVALVAGLYMAWSIGANDVANAMGTSVGSKALTLGSAVVVAAIFEFSGAFFAGSDVAVTIKENVVDTSAFAADRRMLGIGMVSALVGAALWLHLATWRGWPDSTTHAIVGAVTGIGLMLGGLDVVRWSVVGTIVVSWVASPILGAVMSFTVFTIVRWAVFRSEHPALRARMVTPIFAGIVLFIITLAMIYKGLKNLHLNLPLAQALGTALVVGIGMWLAGSLFMRRWRVVAGSYGEEISAVEKQFAYLQIVTACYMAFAHGSNDAANAIGPLAAAITAAQTTELAAQVEVPAWIMGLGAFGIVLGLSTYGYRVIHTIGRRITEVTPSRGFAMEFAAASTVLLGSKLGLPVSTTHILIGAVVGVGMARGMAAINTRMVTIIFLSWLGTVPSSAIFSVGVFWILVRIL